MRIIERCGCGASIEAEGNEFDHLGDLAAAWRSDHRHDCRPLTATESDEQTDPGVTGPTRDERSTTAAQIERDEPTFGFSGESVVIV